MLRWQYKVSLFLIILAQVVFFLMTIYHTDSTGYSWILHHQLDYVWSFILVLSSSIFFIYGVMVDETEKGRDWID